MPRVPQHVLKLLHDEAVAESPYQHIANAVQMLFLAEARVAELMMPPDELLLDLIRRAEARCFHAIFELGREDA